jgi:hypothetical protein
MHNRTSRFKVGSGDVSVGSLFFPTREKSPNYGSRLGIAYYCLAGLDLLGVMDEDTKVSDSDKTGWRDWIWGLSVREFASLRTGGN